MKSNYRYFAELPKTLHIQCSLQSLVTAGETTVLSASPLPKVKGLAVNADCVIKVVRSHVFGYMHLTE